MILKIHLYNQSIYYICGIYYFVSFISMAKKIHLKNLSNFKSKMIKKNIRRMNPSVFTFNNNSYFIYEPRLSTGLYQKLDNNNFIKPITTEVEMIQIEQNKISNTTNFNNVIYITNELQQIFLNVQKVIPKKDDKSLLIETIINENSNYGHLSIKKISEEYNKCCQLKGLKKISKTEVHKIIKNVLLLLYRKTQIKNNKLLSESYIKYEFYFSNFFTFFNS